MDVIVLAIASIAWGAVLVGAAYGLQQVGSLRGSARQALWRITAILLVAPWIAAPLADLAGIGLPAPAVVQSAPVIDTIPYERFSVDTLPSAEPAVVVASPPAAPAQPIPWATILVVVIALGWGWRFIAARLSAWSLKRIVAKSAEAGPGPARQSLVTWSRRLKLETTPSLRIVEKGLSPFSFGIVRPVICLPEGLDRQLDAEALDLVVAHECLHTARGDGWLRPLERFAGDLVWFNPFAWRIRRELDVARELACDEAVLKHVHAHRAYAHTLRNVASIAAGLGSAVPATSMSLSGSPRSLMLRMKQALNGAKTKPARTAIVGVALFGVAGMLAACVQGIAAAPRVEAERVDAGSAALQAQLDAARADPRRAGSIKLLEALLEQAQAAEAPDAATNVVRANAPIRILFAGKLNENGNYVELEQTRDTAGSPGGCMLEAYHFVKLNVREGQELKPGDVVGIGRPVVQQHPSCLAMLDGISVSEEILRREPRGVRFSEPVLKIDGLTGSILSKPTRISSQYGFRRDPFTGRTDFHDGIDLAAALGDPVRAPAAGTIRFAEIKDTLGRTVELAISPEHLIRFAHLGNFTVKAGDTVEVGQVIGSVGTDSNSTGPHVHLEYYWRGKSYDPLKVQNLILAPREKSTLRVRGATHPIVEVPAVLIGEFGYRPDPFTGKTAFHEGVDLRAGLGTPIMTPVDGIITYAGVKGSYGRVVELDAGGGVKMRFGHLNAITVDNDTQVKAGQQIGTMGSSGRSTGSHLHFEYYRNGRSYDPRLVENLVLATSMTVDLLVTEPAPPTPTPIPPAPVAPDALPQLQQNPAPPTPAPLIKAWYPARVLNVQPGRKGGFRVDVVQTADTDQLSECWAMLDRLVDLQVTRGQELKVGDPIGRGAWGEMDVGVDCARDSEAALNAAFPGRAAALERRFANGGPSSILRGGFNPSLPGREIRAWYPAKVALVDGSAEGGYKIRLVQTQDTTTVRDCTVGLSKMKAVHATVGETLAVGDLIGVGSPEAMDFRVTCRETLNEEGRSPMLTAFPELRNDRQSFGPPEPTVGGLVQLGSTTRGPGPIPAPFDARVTKVERLGDLYAVNLEATGAVTRGSRVGAGCSTRMVGLASVSVKEGDAVKANDPVGVQPALEGFDIRCRSIGPAPQPTSAPAAPNSPQLIPIQATAPVADPAEYAALVRKLGRHDAYFSAVRDARLAIDNRYKDQAGAVVIAALNEALKDVEGDRKLLSRKYAEKHPEMQAFLQEIAALQKALADEKSRAAN